MREIQSLRDMDSCANVIHLKSVYKEKNEVYLVMDYAEGGPLYDFIVSH